jgi:CheY-like chemotaxis protein
MDIIMPRMDGIQASQIIKRLPSPPMIIAVSAAVQDSDKSRWQRAGIDGYLSKPIVREKLESVLSPMLKQSRNKTASSK